MAISTRGNSPRAPHWYPEEGHKETGITIREYFALQIFNGMLMNTWDDDSKTEWKKEKDWKKRVKAVANAAVSSADILLKELES